jgi:hypothetical protein
MVSPQLWTKKSNLSIINAGIFVMLVLLLGLFLNVSAPIESQNTLRLPDVTLLGEYTVYLPAPEPKTPQVPDAAGLSDHRLGNHRMIESVVPAPPAAPDVYWQSIPSSAIGPPGLLPDVGLRSAGESAASSAGWRGKIDYIPGKSVGSVFETARTSGLWNLSGDLRVDLADGWVSNPPDSQTDVLFDTKAQRRSQTLSIEAGVGTGAYYPSSGGAVYSLDLLAGLHGQAGILRWRESTQLFGTSVLPGGSPPAEADVQRGAVQQDLQLELIGSGFGISAQAGGILAGELSSSEAEEHGRLVLDLVWQPPSSILRVRAGGSALYYDGSLSFYPSGSLELYASDLLTFLVRAAPFLRIPTRRSLLSSYAVEGLEQLQAEGGYSVFSELRIEPAPSFSAWASFEWRKGSIYFFDASHMEFADANQGVLAGDLFWQIRAARPAVRVDLTARMGFPFPLTLDSWPELLYRYAGLVWRTGIHKPPLEFIIKGLAGQFADDGSQPFLFTDWEIVSGLMASIEGNCKVGKRGTVHAGFETFFSPNPTFSFLIGYGIGY